MRSFVVFLVLLAIGLAVLGFLGGFGGRGVDETAASAPNDRTRLGPDTPVDVFMPKKGLGADGLALSPIEGLVLPFEVPRSRDSQPSTPRRAELRADVVRPSRDGSAALERTTLVVPSENDGPPELEVTADRGHAQFTGVPPSLAGGPCSLENATITYRDPKGALGALTLTTPSLSATIENDNPKKDGNPKYTVRSFSTADPYQIVGEAIRGTGTGFVFDLAEGSYTFLKDPNFDLRPGASPKLDQKIRLRSRGKADLRRESPAPGAPLVLRLRDDAFFRVERPDGSRSFETEGQELCVTLVPDENAKNTSDFGALKPRSFEAKGNVLFRGEPLEGKCASASGEFASDKLLRSTTLVGPYRLDLRIKPSSRAVPGLGSPQSVVVSGDGEAKATLIDPTEQPYRLELTGRPRLDFVEPQSKTPASVVGSRMTAIYGKDGISEFHAYEDVEIHGSYGTLKGDTADFTDLGGKRALVLSSQTLADLDLNHLGAASGARSDTPTFTKLALKAKRVRFESGADRGATHVVAEGSVDGTAADAQGGSLAFKSDRLETTVGKPDERSIDLDGSVQATFEERNLRLVGHHLSFTETKGATGPARSGELTGSNAVIDFLENGVSARSIRSPRITFDNDRIDAQGPVDVKIPSSSLTGASPARGKAAEPLTISGSRLEATLDAQGRATSATLLGPLHCAEPFSIVGDRLVLDLRSGHHTLIANEGTRAVLARAKSDDAAGFRAEAPRIEVENDSQTFVMAGGGILDIHGAPLDLQAFGPRDPNDRKEGGSIRFETSRDVRISPGRASFLGDVTASSSDKGGWRLHSDRLDIDLDDARRPVRVTAAGNVVFDIGGRLSGKGDSLRYGEGTQLLELDGSPMHRAELHMGAGEFMGLGLKCNLRTFLVESGPAEILLKPRASNPNKNGPR